MNINNGISQYNNYVNNIATTSSSSMSKDSVSNLKEGAVFEGSINSIDDKGRVIIGLSNGSTLSARLDSGVSLSTGQSLFFQVKSNDGALIQIKPVALDINSNPTLLKALDSASIMATEKTVSMVNLMMQESLPIDSESLVAMNRLLLNNPTINPETIVTMAKLNLPVTTENANMFEAYAAGTVSIATGSDIISETIPKLLTDPLLSTKDAININNQLNNLFLELSPLNDTVENDVVGINVDSGFVVNENDSPIQNAAVIVENSLEESPEENISFGAEMKANASSFLADVLPEKQLASLQNIIESYDGFKEVNEKLFLPNGSLSPSVSSTEIFKAINDYFTNNPDIPRNAIDNLFKSNAYHTLLKNLISNTYSISPENITKPGAVSEAFERILKLADNIEKIFSDHEGKSADSLKNATSQIRNNINFMNSANEIYNFIQIPLKMYKQNTEGSLYVRQNKKSAYEKGEEISCYLHFDMEHLGSTDIYIKLQKMNVDCQWHLADEASMKLIEDNINILNDRLNKLGFNCKMEVLCDETHIDFLKDFLRAEEIPDAGSMLHRYSFDMKA